VLGHRAEYVTFAWMVWEVTHDALYLGYLGLAQGVPLVLFQLWGGVLADRTNRVRLLLGTQILTTSVLLVAFALSVAGVVHVAHLLALAALSNTFRAFDEPSRMSLVPQMVERDRLPNAIALGSIPWQAGRMIGPSITGVLIAAFGGTVGLGLAATSSIVALGMYSRLRVSADAPAGFEFRREASAPRLARVHSIPSGAIARFHQSVSGSASRRSSQKDKAASTTDSLKRTRGGGSFGCAACQRPPGALRSRSSRCRSWEAAVAASDSLCGLSSSSRRSAGDRPYAIHTSGRIGKSCVKRRC